jgi:hypothetical protein
VFSRSPYVFSLPIGTFAVWATLARPGSLMFYVAFSFAIVASLFVLAYGVLAVIDYGIDVVRKVRGFRNDH